MSTITIKDPNAPASESQLSYLKSLTSPADVEPHSRARAIAEIHSGSLNKGRASDLIDWLKVQPKMTQQQAEALHSPVVDGPGVYVGGSGKIYVASQKQGYKFPVWKQVYVSAAHFQKPKLLKVYSGSAKTDVNTGGHKMTLDEADAWGKDHQFNGMSFCLCCGKMLTAAESVKFGIGPVCRGKSVWA